MKTCSMRCKHIVLGARQARIVLIKKKKTKNIVYKQYRLVLFFTKVVTN